MRRNKLFLIKTHFDTLNMTSLLRVRLSLFDSYRTKPFYGFYVILLIFCAGFSSCFQKKSTQSVSAIYERKANAADIIVPQGYKIEPLISGLNFPTAIAFDDKGIMYVTEAGGLEDIGSEPRLLKILNGNISVIARDGKNGRWNSIVYHEGNFYVTDGNAIDGGKVLKISREGKINTLIDKLPSQGDHHTNGLVIKDNYIYFGQGTATNSGIVGVDNYKNGWLKKNKTFHDIPCQDITLLGENFSSKNFFKSDSAWVKTGAFSSYGLSTNSLQVIKGGLPCNGAVMRIPLAGGKPELVAWGFRDPTAIAKNGEKLYLIENSYDNRGNRPVKATGSVLWELKQGSWYGWPDFHAGMPLKDFTSPGKDSLKPLIQKYPSEPPQPLGLLGNSLSKGIEFSNSNLFGIGDAYIAQFGELASTSDKGIETGFKILKVNAKTGKAEDFIKNKVQGPASWTNKAGLERPASVKFSPNGDVLYIVDFGVVNINSGKLEPVPNTGVIWKVSKK